MNQQQIKNLIKIWYGRQNGENDYFIKFFMLWICFNAWLEYRSKMNRDADMLNWLIKQTSQNSDLISAYESQKKSNKASFQDSIKWLIKSCPISDSRGQRPDINIRNENDFENIIWVIYRIRCNLFHGSKQPNDSRDQKLVVFATNILNHWIACLISSWKN